MVESRCGLLCSQCTWRERMNCPGCLKTHGQMFHGQCDKAICCEGRGHEHCGKCGGFPCNKIIELANDPVHGDGGKILDRLRQWSLE